jgi:hypothetical protein
MKKACLSSAGIAAAFLLFATAANAGTITTTFVADNSYSGNFFDISTGANDLTVTDMLVNVDGGPMTIDVYAKSGSYVGSEANSAAWTLVSQTAITGLGGGTPTPVDVADFVLSAGAVTGLYVTIDTHTNRPLMYYTDGNNTFSNADLTLTAGKGSGGLFTELGLFSNRTWNGTINYVVGAPNPAPEPITLTIFGAGLAGVAATRRRKKAA